jgi:hypothetical protein
VYWPAEPCSTKRYNGCTNLQILAGGFWPILAAFLIYAIEHIDDGVQTGRHIADGSIFFCKRKNDDEQNNGTDLYLLTFSLEPVLLAIKHGHHRTWTCFTAAGAIVQQVYE